MFPTCAFLGAARSLAVHPKLATKVFLPEFCKPDVPAVVGQRAALKVTVKCCGKRENCYYDDVLLQMSSELLSGLLQAFLRSTSCLTVHWRPLGEDGDGALGHLLLLDHRRDLRAPTVRAHPQEVACQVVVFCRIQDSPVGVTDETDKTANERVQRMFLNFSLANKLHGTFIMKQDEDSQLYQQNIKVRVLACS